MLALLIMGAQVHANNAGLGLKDSMLWKVTGNGLSQPSYLLGTMHMVCDDDLVSSPKVQQAIKATDQLYMELDANTLAAPTGLFDFLKDQPKVADIKDDAKKAKLKKLVSERFEVPGPTVENMHMMLLFSLVTAKLYEACPNMAAVEDHVSSAFDAKGEANFGLETLEEQLGFLVKSGLAEIDDMILAFETFDQAKAMAKELQQHYKNQSINDLYRLMTTPAVYYTEDQIEKMVGVMLNERNNNWVKKLPAVMAEKPTFVAVGAGHLPGPGGVINLLREQGYAVEAVMD